MAQLPTGPFNAADVPPAEDFTPIPAGEYLMQITDSDMKATKDGTGQYLELTLQVIDGEHKGRLCWDRLNLINKNPKAVEIAQRSLSSICRATGVPSVHDSAQLHGKPLVARVKYVEPQGQYDAKNDIKAYKPASGAPATAGQPASAAPAKPAQAAAQQPAAASNQPPWATGNAA